MDTELQQTVLTSPRLYLARMVIFLILAAFIIAILNQPITRAFVANPALNGLIVGTLVLGIAYGFRQIFRLFPEVNWVNGFRIADPGLEIPHTPVLLAPMATLLRDRQGRMSLSTMSMRSLLDSLASRLDEARDISRYLIGLLIFLGLLGTFWGLLETVTAVSATIRSLDISQNESGVVLDQLKTGLEAPLQGMGTAFSSSLFGLAGSLILGFLDLQASQAQNRFYNDLEDWLSTVTDITAGDGGGFNMPNYLRTDLRDMQENLQRIDDTLQDTITGDPDEPADMGSIEMLAEAVHGLVKQMRDEQKVVRQWAQSQADQQTDIKLALERLAEPPPEPPARTTRAPRAKKGES
jgi:hypothetical protein